MLCEGLCDGWFHPHCAGLSVAHFGALSASLDTFLCAGCSHASYKKEFVDLRNTVNTLQEEVSQHRNILEEKVYNYVDAYVPTMPQIDGHQMKTQFSLRGLRDRGRVRGRQR